MSTKAQSPENMRERFARLHITDGKQALQDLCAALQAQADAVPYARYPNFDAGRYSATQTAWSTARDVLAALYLKDDEWDFYFKSGGVLPEGF